LCAIVLSLSILYFVYDFNINIKYNSLLKTAFSWSQ